MAYNGRRSDAAGSGNRSVLKHAQHTRIRRRLIVGVGLALCFLVARFILPFIGRSAIRVDTPHGKLRRLRSVAASDLIVPVAARHRSLHDATSGEEASTGSVEDALAGGVVLPRMVVLMLTYAGVTDAPLWEAWHEQFMNHLKARGWAEPEDTTTPYLQAFVTYLHTVKPANVIPRLPAWMRSHLIVDPPFSAWANVTKLMREAYRQALKAFPDSDYFLTVSDSTAPVKAAKDIWADIASDTRTRMDIMCTIHSRGAPKASQFWMLSRQHLEVLADPNLSGHWDAASAHWEMGHCQLYGASDELWPARGLFTHRHYSEDTSCFPKSLFVNESLKWSELVQRYDQRFAFNSIAGFDSNTFIDWNHLPIESLGVGGPSAHRVPTVFTKVQENVLRILQQSPYSWFIRKVRQTTTVIPAGNLTPEQVELGFPPLFKAKYPQDTPEALTLNQFLPKLWESTTI